jgi:hypothetical protein
MDGGGGLFCESSTMSQESTRGLIFRLFEFVCCSAFSSGRRLKTRTVARILHGRLHEILEEAMNLLKLLPQLRGVLALQVYLPLKLTGALELKIELFAHLVELVVNDSQDVRA